MLTLDDLTLSYGQQPVLRGISLRVEAGEVLALIGPNGCGKSTLIRAASGSLTPAAGRVSVCRRGLPVEALHRWPPDVRARQIAVAPQAVRLPEAFTALEVVLMGRTAHLGWLGREGEADRRIALAAMERTCTAELAARPIGSLSGGEQQRVLIARALAQSAPILLMDEPTAHLDLRHQAGILGLVASLAHEQGLAVLVALHDLNLAARHADRVALLAGGELCAVGAPEQVLSEGRLSAAYDLPIRVVPHPIYGTPLVLPDGQPTAAGTDR